MIVYNRTDEIFFELTVPYYLTMIVEHSLSLTTGWEIPAHKENTQSKHKTSKCYPTVQAPIRTLFDYAKQ